MVHVPNPNDDLTGYQRDSPKKKLGTLRDNSADGGNGGGHGGGMEEKKDKYVEKLKQERKLTSGHRLRLCDRSIKLKPKTLSQYNLNANY